MIEENKKQLREEMLINRAKFRRSEKIPYDNWICEQIESIIDREGYQTIHAYLPMGKEINISPLLENLLKKGIKIVTPKTLPKRKLENRVLTSLTEIEKGVFGTTHPTAVNIYEGPFDLVIIPGLAFDKNLFRLGYGGGYYDNFLVHHPKSYKLGIFYPFQEIDEVPTEPHDIQLDEILVKRDEYNYH